MLIKACANHENVVDKIVKASRGPDDKPVKEIKIIEIKK